MRKQEWICGHVTMPTRVDGENGGPSYRPEALLWLRGDATVLGSKIFRPGELRQHVGPSFRQTVERPMAGPPHRPSRVRVASAEVAAILREEDPALEVSCAATPEIDAFVDDLRRVMASEAIRLDLDPRLLAGFFRATAALVRAAPWDVLPADADAISVTIAAYDTVDGALGVLGRSGEDIGLLLFESLADYDRFPSAAETLHRGGGPAIPPHIALTFETPDDRAVRDAIATHGWELAAPDACPSLLVLGADLEGRSGDERETAVFEAIATALPAFLEEAHGAWDETVEQTRTVSTSAGPVEVTFRYPHERPAEGVMARMRQLARRGAVDIERLEPLHARLVAEFEASPEAAALAEGTGGAPDLIMNFAAVYCGSTMATLTPRLLAQIVFEIVPRKAAIDPAEARSFLDELVAFVAFLGRAHSLPAAAALRRVLGRGAVERFRAELANPRNFGIAKQLLAGGAAAGFDMQTQEGIDAWVNQVQSRPESFNLGPTRVPVADRRAEARAKKKRRKAQEKARRRGR